MTDVTLIGAICLMLIGLAGVVLATRSQTTAERANYIVGAICNFAAVLILVLAS